MLSAFGSFVESEGRSVGIHQLASPIEPENAISCGTVHAITLKIIHIFRMRMTNLRSDPRPFLGRAFVTFYVVLSFIILAVTGIVLFITPPGRIANWSDWRLLGFSKSQWQAVHTVFSFLFVIAASFHLFFNWKVIMGYLARKYREGINKRRELTAALTLSVIILVMAADGIAPFGTLMAWGEELRNGWSTPATEPPVPHAELLTLTQLAEGMHLRVDQVIATLVAGGLVPDSASMTVSGLARKYALTPKQVYERIPAIRPGAAPTAAGGGPGYGRRTVGTLCDDEGIDTQTALTRLAAAGITTDAETSIRSLSQSTGKTPVAIVGIIRGQSSDNEQ
jgi:hypothetical protein